MIDSAVIGAHPDELSTILKRRTPDRGIISSVRGSIFFENVEQLARFPLLRLSHKLHLPFQLDYLTPETLGLDRIALAAAAIGQYPSQDCLVIDAGTCITYDFVSADGVYQGGAISPGVEMRFKAMEHFTAKLPLSDRSYFKDIIGKSTHGSLASGVVSGVKEEVKGTIEHYVERFPELITIITGGDASLFDDLLKNTIFAAPDFLLKGLNNILDYHAEMR